MKNIFFILILYLTASNSAKCQPTQITNFDQLLTALKTGEDVCTVIDYSKCKLLVDGKEEKAPEAIGGMGINPFEYFAKGAVKNSKAFITASENKLISHPKYGYVYNYVKIRIYEDNTVELIARYLEPKTFEVLLDEKFYSTIAADKDAAVVFYKK